MNTAQWMGLARQVLPVLGTLLASLGFIKPASVATFTDTAMQALGAVMVLVSIAWSIWSKTNTNIVAAASAVPEVKAITVSDPAMAQAAKNADPATNVQVKS